MLAQSSGIVNITLFCSSLKAKPLFIDCSFEVIYTYIYIYTNLPVNAIVRLPHPRSGDSQGQETILAPYIYIYICYVYTYQAIDC